MASYHFSVKSKNKGYALGHYLYIARLMQYKGVRTKSAEVLEHVEPGRCMPAWVKDPLEFWQAADTFERANAKVYMEYEIALPNEFTVEQRKTLVETFIDKTIAIHNYPHSYAIHNVKSRLSGEDQPHCHLMFSLKADDGIQRSPEQYFKRYNAKDPSKGGAKKIQLQDGYADYSTYLLHIRKAWENHLNDALAKYSPTVTYQIDGQEIQIKNQVSADNYEKYNEIHGTLYLPEPKLGTDKQNETVEYLTEIKKIRAHNAKERELEQRQQHFEQQHEYFYSCSNDAFSSLEVMHYLNHLIKKASNKKELGHDIDHIIQTQEAILHHEEWDIHTINAQLREARLYPEPDMAFKIRSVQGQPMIEPTQQQKPKLDIQPQSTPSRRNNDYEGPGF
jgi:hypothetical protein